MSTSVNNRDSLRALEERLGDVRSRIAAAARRAGRDPAGVRLVAVTKQVGPETIQAAAAAGIEEFGENYVKDLETKRLAAPDATWHFIGRLQSNKVRRVLQAADVIQTLEPGKAADKLLESTAELEERRRFLIEVDFTRSRVGSAPEELDRFADLVANSGVRLEGLMTVAPQDEDPRPTFARLRELRDGLVDRHQEATHLSMGMSADLEVAVEEGATMVRVGTGIFGPRARR